MKIFKVRRAIFGKIDVVEVEFIQADRTMYEKGDLIFWTGYYPSRVLARGTYLDYIDQGEKIEPDIINVENNIENKPMSKIEKLDLRPQCARKLAKENK